MKKILLYLFAAVTINASAQLTVFESGQTILGVAPASATGSILQSSSPSPTLQLYPMDNQSYTGIGFGSGDGLAVISNGPRTGCLTFKSVGGLYFYGPSTSPVVYYTPSSSDFCFTVPVRSPSFLTTSDMRLKKNISEMEGLGTLLNQLTPVSYQLISQKTADAKERAVSIDEESSLASSEDERMRFGFIAQEIQEIFPNLVVEDEEGMLAIDYTGFIPLLVNAVKDLSAKVKEQEELISTLAHIVSPGMIQQSDGDAHPSKSSELRQNRPNPFNVSTRIEFVVPDVVESASICVFDLQGSQILRLPIQDRGESFVEIEASFFKPGIYVYTLVADGQEIDSRRMIITD